MTFLETIKVVEGQFQNLAAHQNRIRATIGHRLRLPLEVPVEHAHGVVKCRVLYTAQGVQQVDYSPYRVPQIASLKVVECAELDYHLKYADRQTINRLMEQRDVCDDILITQNAMVTDSSFCNLVFENREGLFTSTTPLLNGTKRQLLLAKGMISERKITIADLHHYDRVRLINAMLDLEDGVCVEIPKIWMVP